MVPENKVKPTTKQKGPSYSLVRGGQEGEKNNVNIL